MRSKDISIQLNSAERERRVGLIDLNSDRKSRFANVPGGRVAEKRRTDADEGGVLGGLKIYMSK